MFVVELSANATVHELGIFLQLFVGEHFLGDLELESLKDGLIFEEAGELDVRDQLLHVDQG